MAMAFISRTLVTKQTSKILPSSIFSRSFALKSFSSSSPLCHLRSLASLTEFHRVSSLPTTPSLRCFSSRPTTSSLNDQSPNWNNRPPKETILLEGCDFEHWLIVVEKPEGDPTRDEIIDSYIKIAASIVGSEEEARKQIYSVSTRHYFAFGIIVPEEVSYKFKELPNVRWVLPDSYLDVRNKDYGGEPFINGQAVPYDPKYHEEWVRNNARANERRNRNDRPRIGGDRSRNFDRRRENMQNRDNQGPPGGPGGPGPNMGGASPPPNVQHAGPNMGGAMPPPNVQHAGPNMGGTMPPPNVQRGGPNMGGGMPPPNVQHAGPNMGGGMLPPNVQNNAPNYGSVPPNANMQRGPPNYGGVPPSGNMQNSAPNYGGMPPNAGPNTGYTNMSMGNNTPNYGGIPPRDAGPNAGYPTNIPSRDAGPNAGYPTNIPSRDAGPNAGYPGNFPNAGNAPYGGPSNNMSYQSGDGPGPMPNRDYQNSYVPNRNTGNAGGNAYQVRDMPAGGPPYPNNDY